MALTVGEALAVNTLLSWLLERGVGEHNRVPGAAAATAAARLLAEHADRRLMAGIRGSEVPSLDGLELPRTFVLTRNADGEERIDDLTREDALEMKLALGEGWRRRR